MPVVSPPCPLCQKTFLARRSLLRHLRKVHGRHDHKELVPSSKAGHDVDRARNKLGRFVRTSDITAVPSEESGASAAASRAESPDGPDEEEVRTLGSSSERSSQASTGSSSGSEEASPRPAKAPRTCASPSSAHKTAELSPTTKGSTSSQDNGTLNAYKRQQVLVAPHGTVVSFQVPANATSTPSPRLGSRTMRLQQPIMLGAQPPHQVLLPGHPMPTTLNGAAAGATMMPGFQAASARNFSHHHQIPMTAPFAPYVPAVQYVRYPMHVVMPQTAPALVAPLAATVPYTMNTALRTFHSLPQIQRAGQV